LEPAAAPPGPATAALSPRQWAQLAETAWRHDPALATALQARFAGVEALRSALRRLVAQHAAAPEVMALPQAVQHLATPEAAAADAPQLQHLASWAPVTLLQAMSLISSPAGRHPAALAFLLRSLELCDPEEAAFFLPQLVQLLRHDPGAEVESFLLRGALRSAYFAYLLDCQLAAEGTPPAEAFAPAVRRSGWAPPSDSGLWAPADRVRGRLRRELAGPVRDHLAAELDFFGAVTAVSGQLYPVPKEERKAAAVRLLRGVALPRGDLFMPTDPHARVAGVKPETAAPMQSAAKCPILVAFDVEVRAAAHAGPPTPAVQALIFKVGDDCRQDVLALQVISLLKAEFDAAGLPLPLVPYGVVPTGYECGIIEVVPHAKSRAQLVSPQRPPDCSAARPRPPPPCAHDPPARLPAWPGAQHVGAARGNALAVAWCGSPEALRFR
jgi:phosphatidylinositol 4-kinase